MEREYMRWRPSTPLTGEPQAAERGAAARQAMRRSCPRSCRAPGYFDLADDEALVVTINPGERRLFRRSGDQRLDDHRQLLGPADQPQQRQAKQHVDGNPDGTYTVVISKTDPEVYNWVSTGGLNQGTFSIRFQDLGTTAPTIVSSKVVKISELDDPGVLPPETDFVTPPEREAQIAVRQAGFNNRFAPFPQT